jgi:hypothetical protein
VTLRDRLLPRLRPTGVAEWGGYSVGSPGYGPALRNLTLVVLWRLFGWSPGTVEDTVRWLTTPVSPRTAVKCWALIALGFAANVVLWWVGR